MMMVPRLVHRFRQLLIILLLLLGITTWRNTSSEVTQEQGRDLSLRKSTNFTKGASEAPPGGAIVLVLSSVGRSGSSFLGELIAQLPNTFYNFEPLHFYDRSTREAVTPRLAWDTVKALSSCRLEKDWLRATARRGLLRSEAGTICQTVDAGEAARCAGDFCRNRTRLVLKTIRMRVSWLPELLLHFGSGMKVVHLVRDPRASFRSCITYASSQKDHARYCPLILEDLFMVDTVRRLFPRSLTSVKYEDLCLDAEGVATDLWRFISEDSEAALPPSWSGYIQDHTTPSKASRGPYQTRRDSQKEAEQWRQEIDEELLLGVEKSCGDVIDLLGHNKFHSLANVRNWSFPLRRTPEALYTQTEVL
ncbi:carbohydrate sulfotransferase 3-like isoform X1 [Penaeus monodon]|uniref:carbohydrate sulfotransferase 3-like isoform X1 n=1 Tax=Penaeus monodon TaxID=6687 RepID=UPI0018A6DFB3|nr:carbohydrate sulfotransferase 3-like isoform X1 [Penaeus monodon]XP_037792740.1 carbohydrate sulfotransferase 3-like isoform X1 [Penaeus monodon]